MIREATTSKVDDMLVEDDLNAHAGNAARELNVDLLVESQTKDDVANTRNTNFEGGLDGRVAGWSGKPRFACAADFRKLRVSLAFNSSFLIYPTPLHHILSV